MFRCRHCYCCYLLSSWLWLVVSWSNLPTSLATITVESTGQRLASYPDKLIGKEFDEEYVYLARLQYFPDNVDLCPSSSHTIDYTVTLPPDGRPVALLARGAYCSDVTKARLASLNIQPAGVVKYLIIFDANDYESPPIRTQRHLQQQVQIEDYNDDDDDEEGFSDKIVSLLDVNSTVAEISRVLSTDNDEELWSEIGKTQIPSYNGGGGGQSSRRHSSVKRKHKTDRDPYISVGVLHTSRNSGKALLSQLVSQTDSTRMMGGPKVLLDGRSYDSSKFLRTFLFWLGLSIMVVGCCCSVLLSARVQNMLDHDNGPNNGANQTGRPVRRRLTHEQVEDLLPVYRYQGDGRDLVGWNNPSVSLTGVDLSMCSICLDEYEPGDQVRVLPCMHSFRSKCIAKWLTERSSTCPLCKLDLLVEEEDDESDSDYVELQDGSSDDTNDDEQPQQRESIFDLFLQFGRGFTTTRRNAEDDAEGDIEQGGVSTVPLLADQHQQEEEEEEEEESLVEDAAAEEETDNAAMEQQHEERR